MTERDLPKVGSNWVSKRGLDYRVIRYHNVADPIKVVVFNAEFSKEYPLYVKDFNDLFGTNFTGIESETGSTPDWSEVEVALRAHKEANEERKRIEAEISQANAQLAALRDRLREQERVWRDAVWKYQDALRKVEDSL